MCYSLLSFWAFWVYFVICVCLESEDLVHNSLLIWSKLRNFFLQLPFHPTPTVRRISLFCYMDLSVTILCRSDPSCKTFCRHLLAFPPTTTLQLHKSCFCTILKTHNLFTNWTSKFEIFAITTIVHTSRRSSDTLHCHRKEFETIDCTLKVQAFHLREHLVLFYLVPQRKLGWLVAPGLVEGKHRRCVSVLGSFELLWNTGAPFELGRSTFTAFSPPFQPPLLARGEHWSKVAAPQRR